MAERVPALVAAVLAEGGFDVPSSTALTWLTAAHRLIVKRSSCYRRRISLGTTVAAQSAYPLPAEVVEVREVLVAGVPYGTGQHSDIAASAQSWLFIQGLGGVTADDSSASGESELALVPAPIEGGASIEIYAVCRAPALSESDDSTLKIPPEYDEALMWGAIGRGLAGIEHRGDLAAEALARFQAGSTELRAEIRRRYRPRSARVQGYNA